MRKRFITGAMVLATVAIAALAVSSLGQAEKAPAAPTGAGSGAAKPTTRPEIKLPKEMDVPEVAVPPSPALSPQDALKSFKLAPGIRIELVAAEPLVEDPVAIHFDGNGRLWVCEMRAYMPKLDPGAEEDKPLGQISFLEDTNGDGVMDKKTVFLDGLVMPRACTPYRDGVLVAAPPYVWFVRDTNGDGKADEKQLLATDYTNRSNPEHQPNGLMPGLDNWIHNSQWTGRFRYLGDKIPAQPETEDPKPGPQPDPRWVRVNGPSRGQWGISQDDVGRLYINSNSDQFRGDFVPVAYAPRNPNYGMSAGLNIKVAADQKVEPARPTPGINRGYQPQMLDDADKLTTFTAACAPFIYRGDLLGPEFYGNGFVAEPSGNLIRRNILTEKDGVVSATNAYKDAEFIASTDERFRPVHFATGPEGALYICDMYKGVLQHQRYVTPYLRREIARRNLETPLHMGRIYRVVPEDVKSVRTPPLPFRDWNAASLICFLSHNNGWWRDMAQQQIIARNDPKSFPLLRQEAIDERLPWFGRLHSLWTLEGLNALDEPTLAKALADADDRVRMAAMRLSEPFIAANPKSPLVAPILALAKHSKPEVRIQFLFSASVIHSPEAHLAVAAAYEADQKHPVAKDALMSGVGGQELEFIQSLLASPAYGQDAPARSGLLNALAGCVMREAKPPRVLALLSLIDGQPEAAAWRQKAMLAGAIAPAPKGSRSQTVIRLEGSPPLVEKLLASKDARVKNSGVALSKFMSWPGKVEVRTARARPLTKEEQASHDRGEVLYTNICAACHQTDGFGEPGKAASMRDSPILLGRDELPIRVVLHGLRGPVEFAGEVQELEMPTLSSLNDEQIADILTYVRRAWTHAADPVTAESVAKIREEEKDRGQPWTKEELKELKPPGEKK